MSVHPAEEMISVVTVEAESRPSAVAVAVAVVSKGHQGQATPRRQLLRPARHLVTGAPDQTRRTPHDLGAAASRAVFIAVNVNPCYPGVASMAAYSTEHQLTTIPSWHFFTGPLATLC